MKSRNGNAVSKGMEEKAEDAARLLTTLGHPKRLLTLCHLVEGEKSVGQLVQLIGLSQTALSQHLARMRDLGLVATRREGQNIFYRLVSLEVTAILETLYKLYCAPYAARRADHPAVGTRRKR